MCAWDAETCLLKAVCRAVRSQNGASYEPFGAYAYDAVFVVANVSSLRPRSVGCDTSLIRCVLPVLSVTLSCQAIRAAKAALPAPRPRVLRGLLMNHMRNLSFSGASGLVAFEGVRAWACQTPVSY